MSIAKTLDKYYTRSDVAATCSEVLQKVIDVSKYTWVEPSAGSGAFLFDYVTEAYDLVPEHPSVVKKDWFDVTINTKHGLIGNPPFGKRNKLSKAFIKKAVEDVNCECIAFVLPAVYNKHTLQKVFPDNWKLISNTTLDAQSFTFENDSYSIPSVFQVWVKESSLPCQRAVERKDFSNKHFSICSKESGELFVMGASCNTVKYPNDVLPTNRGYYLQTNSLTVEELKSNIESVNWKGLSSAKGGVAWLTKTEFMNQYEEVFNGSK
jgi:hypothetical protein